MKFKTTNTATAATADNPTPKFKGKFGYCKIAQYKFKDGDNLLRFLPQPADSKHNNFVLFEELNFWSEKYKNKLAILPNSMTAETRLKAFFELRENFFSDMKSYKNQEGTISLNPSYKVGFQAIEHETGEIVAVVLPGTNPMPRMDGTKRNQGAGTKVVELCSAKDIKGNPKFGDIFDVEEGSLINVRVTNAGTLSASYEVLHECKLSIADKDSVLEGIKGFDEVFRFAIPGQLYVALEEYLTPEQFAVCKKLFPSGDPAVHGDEPF